MADNEVNQSANEIAESLFDAVTLIFDTKAAELTYDKTISCTISDVSNASNGEYTVSDGQSSFNAYSSVTTYTKGTNVYVTIPGNDMLNQKLIVGKVSSSDSTQVEPYVSPTADMIDITGNIVEDASDGALLANCPETFNEKDCSSKISQVIWSDETLDLKGLTRLGVKASFASWISDAVQGEYGLEIEIIGTQLQYYTASGMIKSKTVTGKTTVYLSSSEMYGDVYNYSSYYSQEKVFNIENYQSIKGIRVTFYQKQNFEDSSGTSIPYCYKTLDGSQGGLLADNIHVRELQITLGYALTEYTTDTLLVGSLDDTTYAANQDDGENERSLYARWVKITDSKAYAIDNWSEAPDGVSITWFKYEENSTENDVLAGAQWRQLQKGDADVKSIDGFNITVTLDKTLEENKYKAVLENPSLNTIYNELVSNSSSLERAVLYLKSILSKSYPKTYADFYNKLFTRDTTFSSISDVSDYMSDNITCLDEGVSIKTCFQAKANPIKYELYDTEDTDTLFAKRVTYFKNIFQEVLTTVSSGSSLVSEEFVFSNQKDTISSATEDAIKGLTIVCDESGSNGIYKMYDSDDGDIIKKSQLKNRYFEAKLSLSTTDEEELTRAEYIQWKIPKNNTMIYYFPGVSSSPGIDESFASEDSIEKPSNVTDIENYTKKYYDDEKTTGWYENDDYYLIRRKGTEDYNDSSQQIYIQQVFQIASTYIESYTNNTIYCEVKKNNKVWTASYDLTFGYAEDGGNGITGSIKLYRALIDSNKNYKAGTEVTYIDDNANRIYLASLILYDTNKELIQLDPSKLTWRWYPMVNNSSGTSSLDLSSLTTLSVKSTTKADQATIESDENETTETFESWVRDKIELTAQSSDVLLNLSKEITLSNPNYYILQAEYQYTDDTTIKKNLSIPFVNTSGDTYRINFDPTIFYDSAGTNPDYYKDEIEVYDSNGSKQYPYIRYTLEGEEKVENQLYSPAFFSFDNDPDLTTYTTAAGTTDSNENTFFPKIKTITKKDNVWKPDTYFYKKSNDDGSYTYVRDSSLFKRQGVTYYKLKEDCVLVATGNSSSESSYSCEDASVIELVFDDAEEDEGYHSSDSTTKSLIELHQKLLDNQYEEVSFEEKIVGFKIKPTDLYISNLSNIYCLRWYISEDISITYPIIMGIQNQILSSWDGSLTVDEDNNTILAAMVGAGRKEPDDNTFSGVLMGDVNDKVQKYTDSTTGSYTDQAVHDVGLYGYYHGNQSYAFKSDGTAFIGRSGGGRIEFNGNKGIIQNGTYEENQSGMCIDLGGVKSGDLTKTSPSLKLYGDAGGIELTTGGDTTDEDTTSENTFFKIKARESSDSTEFKDLMSVGTAEYFLQTYNYEEDTSGVKIDLKAGKIDAYNFMIKAKGTYVEKDKNGNQVSSSTGYILINSGDEAFPLSIGASTSSSANDFRIRWDGILYAKGGTFDGGTITGGSIEIGTDPNIFVADSEGIRLGKYTVDDKSYWKFSVNSAGSLSSIDGTIGGWIINDGYLCATKGDTVGQTAAIILSPKGVGSADGKAGIYLGQEFTVGTITSSSSTESSGSSNDEVSSNIETSTGTTATKITGVASFSATTDGNCSARTLNSNILYSNDGYFNNLYLWGSQIVRTKITWTLKSENKSFSCFFLSC